jgi:hypothetical protein
MSRPAWLAPNGFAAIATTILDPTAFAGCFAAFLDNLGTDVLAIDCKARLRLLDGAAGRSAVHAVTAFAPAHQAIARSARSGLRKKPDISAV